MKDELICLTNQKRLFLQRQSPKLHLQHFCYCQLELLINGVEANPEASTHVQNLSSLEVADYCFDLRPSFWYFTASKAVIFYQLWHFNLLIIRASVFMSYLDLRCVLSMHQLSLSNFVLLLSTGLEGAAKFVHRAYHLEMLRTLISSQTNP